MLTLLSQRPAICHKFSPWPIFQQLNLSRILTVLTFIKRGRWNFNISRVQFKFVWRIPLRHAPKTHWSFLQCSNFKSAFFQFRGSIRWNWIEHQSFHFNIIRRWCNILANRDRKKYNYKVRWLSIIYFLKSFSLEGKWSTSPCAENDKKKCARGAIFQIPFCEQSSAFPGLFWGSQGDFKSAKSLTEEHSPTHFCEAWVAPVIRKVKV